MKLFYSPFHSFAHKALIVAHEAGLWNQITLVPTFPFRDLNREFVTGRYDMMAITPLGKVPCLALDDGKMLYSSQTVVEYLDSNRVSGEKLYPCDGPERWDALRRLALGDAIFEFSVQMSMENWLDRAERRTSLYKWLWPKIIASLDAAEQWAAGDPQIDIGAFSILQGVSYMGESASEEDPEHPSYVWRDGRPSLSQWFDEIILRPSVQTHYGKDFEGDMSPENHQRHVAEILAAQGKGCTR